MKSKLILPISGRRLLAGLLLVPMFSALTLVAWPRLPAPLANDADGIVIENVRVIDVEAGSVGKPTSVVLSNGRITSIGQTEPPPGLAIIDGEGRFLAPAYWDMHAHTFQHSPQVDFPLWVANGVLNIRDMMDCPNETDSLIACASDKRRWNAQVDAGAIAAPRIVGTTSYYLERPTLTPAEVTALSETYQRRGLDALKVYNRLSRAAYLRAATEARRRSMRLVGHLPKAVSLTEALAAGQSSFEHAHIFARHCFRRADDWRVGRLDAMAPTELVDAIVTEYDPVACEAAFSSMQRSGAWFVPTHVTREEDARAADPRFALDPRLMYLDPLSRWAFMDDLAGNRAAYPGPRGAAALRAYFDHGLRLTGAAHKAGVRVLVGTDTALGGFRYHDEMAHLSRAGLSPADVLRAATIDAARYAGLEGASGSVSIGKRADLVLLDADPFVRIENASRVHAVFIGGRLYDRQQLDALLSFARGQAEAPHNWAKLLWGYVRSTVAADL